MKCENAEMRKIICFIYSQNHREELHDRKSSNLDDYNISYIQTSKINNGDT